MKPIDLILSPKARTVIFMVEAWPTRRALCRRSTDRPSIAQAVVDGFLWAIVAGELALLISIFVK